MSWLTIPSGNVELGGVADGYGNTLLIKGAIGIAQFDLVVTRSKRKFLGFLDSGRITAVNVDLSVLAVSVDLDFTVVPVHVSRRIWVVAVVRIERAKERAWPHNHDAASDSLCRGSRCHGKEKTSRQDTRQDYRKPTHCFAHGKVLLFMKHGGGKVVAARSLKY